jgi:predicted lipid-binding transport protein (Tim44 family)
MTTQVDDTRPVGRHVRVPALPARLEQMAAVLDATAPSRVGDQQLVRASDQAARAAQTRADAARTRLTRLRAAARRDRRRRWSGALVSVLGLGLLGALVVIGLLAALYVGSGLLLLVPLALALVAVVVVTRKLRGQRAPQAVRGIQAAQERVRDAESDARRARHRARQVRDRWVERARAGRADVAAWCRRQSLPVDPDVLRALARSARRRAHSGR